MSDVKAKSKNKTQCCVQYFTISKRLAFEIVSLCNSLGMSATAKFSKVTDEGGTSWSVVFSTETVAKIQSEIVLYHSQKVEKLSRAVIDDNNLKQDRYVPKLSKTRMQEITDNLTIKHLTMCGIEITGDTQKQLKSIQVVVAKTMKTDGVLPLETAKNIVTLIKAGVFQSDIKFWEKWAYMVMDASIEWDVITNIRPIPEITTAYDLTIPPAYTMVTESGLVVWDTETVHVPVTKGAVEDAKNIVPSKQVFSDKKIGSILQFPKGEAVVGLYMGTKNVGSTAGTNKDVKHYTNDIDAWKDYYAGKLKLTDFVQIGS
jgi:ribosomal protein S13